MSKSKTRTGPSIDSIKAKEREKLSFLARMEYKKMITYPLAVFLIALILLAISFPPLGIDLNGGVVVTGYGGVDANPPDELAKYVSDKIGVDVRVERFTGVQSTGVRVYAPAGTDPVRIIRVLKERYPNAEYIHSEVQPTFGKIAQQQGIRALVFAFLAMAAVVFLFFRSLVPSLTIIFSALSDMTIAVA